MKINAYKLFLILGTIFYIIPSSIQIPIIVLYLVILNIYILDKWKKLLNCMLLLLICIFFVFLKISYNTFDTSILIVFLSILPIYYFQNIKISFNYERYKLTRKFLILWMLGIIVQLSFYRYNGRPNMSYEINQSGSFIFLFYLLSDVFKMKYLKIIVILISFLLISRLLIGCILLFELLRAIKPLGRKFLRKLSYIGLFLSASILLGAISIWFMINMADKISGGGDDISRLTTLADGSNYIRFKINADIILNFISGNDSHLYTTGYGDLGQNKLYINKYILMPHNEFLKGIAQYGIGFIVFCMCISKRAFREFLTYTNIEFISTIIIYTLILWVKFFITPSPEMFFILLLLLFKGKIEDFHEGKHLDIKYHKVWRDRESYI